MLNSDLGGHRGLLHAADGATLPGAAAGHTGQERGAAQHRRAADAAARQGARALGRRQRVHRRNR